MRRQGRQVRDGRRRSQRPPLPQVPHGVTMNRREFLVGVPLVFGLRELLAQDPPAAKNPAWLDEAFKRMKATARCGVVIVAPTEAADAKSLGQSFLELMESNDAD